MWKSLLYRELYVGKGYYIGSLVGMITITMLAYLVRLSLKIGNLSHLPPETLEDVNEVTLSLFLILIPIMYFGMMGNNGVHLSDVRSKYQLFGYTLPVSPLQQTAVKYILKVICFCIGCLLSWVLVLIMRTTEIVTDDGLMLKEMTPVIYVIAMLAAFLDSYQSALLFRCRTAKQCTAVTAFTPVLLILLGMVGMKVLVSQILAYMDAHPNDYEGMLQNIQEMMFSFMNGLPVIAPIVIMVLFAISFFLSYFSIKRREK